MTEEAKKEEKKKAEEEEQPLSTEKLLPIEEKLPEEKTLPGLEARYSRYRLKLKKLTIMSDIFGRNVLKDQRCTEHILRIILQGKDLKVVDQKLQESYVIFITRKDALGKDLPILHIDRIIQETGEKFGDQAHMIYVDASKQDENTELGRLMHDLNCRDAADMQEGILVWVSKHPNLWLHGLFCAAHSHVYAPLRSVQNVCQ